MLTLPLQGAAILVLASVLGWSGWMTFSYARPVRSRRVVAVYLCAVGFQLVHMAEEYTGAFPHEIVELFDSPRDWPEREFLLVFVFGFGALCFFAGAGALYFLIKGERRLEAAEQEEQVRLPVAYARQPGDPTGAGCLRWRAWHAETAADAAGRATADRQACQHLLTSVGRCPTVCLQTFTNKR